MTQTAQQAPQPRQTKVDFQEQATPWLIQMTIPREDIQGELDLIWEDVKPRLSPKAWRGFRPGSDAFRPHWEQEVGLAEAYYNAWTTAIAKAAASQKHFVLSVDQMSVQYVADLESFKVAAVVFYMPKMTFRESMDKIPVEIYQIHPDLVKQQTDSEIHNIALREQKFQHAEGKAIAMGDKVTLKIEAFLDGKPWKEGCKDDARAVVKPNTIFPEEMRDGLLGKKLGDVFTVECAKLPPMWGEHKDKHWKATISVRAVQEPIEETIDEYCKRAGFGSEPQARARISERVRHTMTLNRENLKQDLALHHLRANAVCDPVPLNWLRVRATQEFQALVQQQKGKTEKQVAGLMGATDRSMAVAMIIPQVADRLRDEIAMLAFADTHGRLDYTKPMEECFTEAKQFMLENLLVTEVVPQSIQAKAAEPSAESK